MKQTGHELKTTEADIMGSWRFIYYFVYFYTCLIFSIIKAKYIHSNRLKMATSSLILMFERWGLGHHPLI